MATIFKKFIVTFAALVALAGAACSSSDSTDTAWSEELIKAGFTDPVLVAENDEAAIIMASAGSCRLRFVGDNNASRMFVTIPDAPTGEEGSYIGDPSLALLRDDERFSNCFSSSEEKQS